MPGRSFGSGVDGIGANLEGAQIEVAGGARRSPARIFAARRNRLHPHFYDLVVKRRDPHRKFIADFQISRKIFAQIETKPDIAEIDQRQQRNARRNIFAEFAADLINLRRDRGP